MDYDLDEDDDFVLKEPTFREEKPSKPPRSPFTPSVSRALLDALLIIGVTVVAFVVADVTSKLVNKWLD